MLRDIPDSRSGGILKEVLRGMLAELSVRLEVPTESAKIQQAIQDALPGGNSEIGDVLADALASPHNTNG